MLSSNLASVCLGRLERADVKVYCHKVLLCDSSGEYLESDIYVNYSYPEM